MNATDKPVVALHTLRINIKSLAEEARINREEAKLATDSTVFNSLVNHRRGPLRREARYAQLSLAFLRQMPYRRIESKTREGNEPCPKHLTKKLRRFVEGVDSEAVRSWLSS